MQTWRSVERWTDSTEAGGLFTCTYPVLGQCLHSACPPREQPRHFHPVLLLARFISLGLQSNPTSKNMGSHSHRALSDLHSHPWLRNHLQLIRADVHLPQNASFLSHSTACPTVVLRFLYMVHLRRSLERLRHGKGREGTCFGCRPSLSIGVFVCLIHIVPPYVPLWAAPHQTGFVSHVLRQSAIPGRIIAQQNEAATAGRRLQ